MNPFPALITKNDRGSRKWGTIPKSTYARFLSAPLSLQWLRKQGQARWPFFTPILLHPPVVVGGRGGWMVRDTRLGERHSEPTQLDEADLRWTTGPVTAWLDDSSEGLWRKDWCVMSVTFPTQGTRKVSAKTVIGYFTVRFSGERRQKVFQYICTTLEMYVVVSNSRGILFR